MAITIGALTTGLQTVTATGAVTPTAGLDVSGITGDWTIFVQVPANTTAKNAKIVIESSVNAFTAASPELIVDLSGKYVSASDVVAIPMRKYQRPSSVIGTASAVLRARVDTISSSDSLSLQAWIAY